MDLSEHIERVQVADEELREYLKTQKLEAK